MTLFRKHLSPVIRSVAGLALGFFVIAQTLCFVHCEFQGGNERANVPSCHSGGTGKPCHDGSSSAPESGAACPTLKVFLASQAVGQASDPELIPLGELPATDLNEHRIAMNTALRVGRHAHSANWVFTPEVCLGPAFRSLAPPVWN